MFEAMEKVAEILGDFNENLDGMALRWFWDGLK
jgi:hypothetical protein